MHNTKHKLKELQASADTMMELRKRNAELYKQNKDLTKKLKNLEKRIDKTVDAWTDIVTKNAKPTPKQTDKEWAEKVVWLLFRKLEKLISK